MTDQRATQAAGAVTPPEVAPMPTPAPVSGATGQRPAVRPLGEDRLDARRPSDPIVLALAAAIAEIVARRAASAVNG